MKKNNIVKELLFYLILFVVIIVAIAALYNGGSTQRDITYKDLISYFNNEQVTEVYVSNKNIVTLKLKEGVESTNEVSYKLRSFDKFDKDFSELINEQVARGIITYVEYQPAAEMPWWLMLLPGLIVIVLLVVGYIFFAKQMNGKGGAGGGKFNSFSRARVKTPAADDKKKVLFRDVAGADEEKEELVEIVEFLKDPSKFTKLGAKIPHGVLLVGPPGTGKTLLAKAVAGEAGVPFYSISGSDFVEMYVGVGASRVRDLFETARRAPASIIFIDEIDAVGRHRGAGLGGGHDEREQTLNQLLVEMDGFGSHDGIIVIAATNRPDILDPALLRPGRFDRQVTVNYPDIKGREEILKVHARNKPLEESVDFKKIAQTTVGFTGADLANLLNEAALLAAKKGKSLIGMDDIEESFMKEILGPQKKSKIRTEDENKLTAYHEAGHAVVSYYCKNTHPVKHITIIPAGRAGGVTVTVPEKDVSYTTKGYMIDRIRMGLGGRIAEELIMDDISTGASGDIQQVTQTARNMIKRYGMSDKLGTVLYDSEHSRDEVFLGRDFSSGANYSEQTAAAIDEEIRTIISNCYADAKAILEEHIDKLHFVAQYLLKHESMDGDQFAAAMKDGATEEELDAIAAEKAEKSRLDNERRAAEQKKAEAEKAASKESDSKEDGAPKTDAEKDSEDTSKEETAQEESNEEDSLDQDSEQDGSDDQDPTDEDPRNGMFHF